ELTGLGCRGRRGEGAGREMTVTNGCGWKYVGVAVVVPDAAAVRARVREEMSGPRGVCEDGSRAPWADGGVTEGCARAEVEGAPSSAAAVDVAEMTYTLGAEGGGADE
ncbi:unnamed protein product, partial [Pylaiella littoralis]